MGLKSPCSPRGFRRLLPAPHTVKRGVRDLGGMPRVCLWAGCHTLPFSAPFSFASHSCSPKWQGRGGTIKLQSCSPTSNTHQEKRNLEHCTRTSQPGPRASSVFDMHRQSWCPGAGLARTRCRRNKTQPLDLPLDCAVSLA